MITGFNICSNQFINALGFKGFVIIGIKRFQITALARKKTCLAAGSIICFGAWRNFLSQVGYFIMGLIAFLSKYFNQVITEFGFLLPSYLLAYLQKQSH